MALGGWPRSRVPAAALGAGVCLAALAAWTAISIGWASDNGGAFVEVVRVLGYLGVFVLVVIASPRASARAWLGGLALGLVIVAGLALLSRFEPSFGGDKELGTFLPAAAGRLSYPIGYWNGLAAVMAIAVVLLVWLGGQARAAWVRAAAVAADPVADPRHLSGLVARRGDRRAWSGSPCCWGWGRRGRGWSGALPWEGPAGRCSSSLASRQHELVDGLGNSAAAAQGDQMLALSIAVVLAVGILRFLLDPWLGRIEVPARMTRAVGVAAVVAVIGGILLAGPSKRWEEFKRGRAAGDEEHLRRGSLEQRARQRPLSVLVGGGRCLQGPPCPRHRRRRLRGLLGPARLPGACRSATLTRSSSRRMAELGVVGLVLVLGFLGFAAVSGSRRGPTRSRGGALGAALAILAAGIVSAAIDWTWELPACFGLVVLAAALLTGPATLAPEPALGAVAQAVDGWQRREARERDPLDSGSAWRRCSSAGPPSGPAAILFLTEVRLGDSRSAASDRGPCVRRAGRARREHAPALGGGPPAPARPRRGAGRRPPSRQSRPRRGDPARPRQLAALVRACAVGGQVGRRRRGPPGAGRVPASSTRGPRSFSVTARSGPRAHRQGCALDRLRRRPGRERWILPFTAGLAAGLVLAGLAAAVSWIDWRWVLLGLCAVAVVAPVWASGAARQARLFEPLTWFALMFLLLFVARPGVGPRARELHLHGAADLPDLHQDARRRSAGGSGLRDRLPDPGGRVAGVAASAPPDAGVPPSADLVDARVRCRSRGVRGLLRRGARVA